MSERIAQRFSRFRVRLRALYERSHKFLDEKLGERPAAAPTSESELIERSLATAWRCGYLDGYSDGATDAHAEAQEMISELGRPQ